MNKPALKKFATEARRELLERVELQARKIGITSEGIQKAAIESSDAIFIDGKQLKEKERVQRNKLINRIREIGFDRVMEEVSYTWFNRFTALRFMEINDYLPTKVRVLSSVNPESTEPDMMKEALNLDLGLDKEYIYELKMTNNDEELFKYLMIKHCNDLNRYMPFMFETIDDYTEILFPEGLLATDSCIRKMTNIEVIPEKNWGKIEVIGWLYQYYIAEEKDRVFKEKKKYKAEEIPFATQLFTPDWIVRYMVQNSLGRYWVEAHPDQQELINNWEFYLQNTEEDFNEKIAPYINKELKVEEIKCFDPAMGSGHILVYMFDVLYEIYSKSGYMEREIPRLIIENNLYGLDIDDRAYQLASFSVVMKALEYNKRFLRSIEKEGLLLNLASIQETNSFTQEDIEFIAGNIDILEETENFLKQFQHAKTIGSLIKVKDGDTRNLEKRMQSIQTTAITDLFEFEKREKVLSLLPKIIKQAKIMSLDFDILVTNPPYMGSGSMNKELSDYLKKHYPDSKTDLFAAFMQIDHYSKENGFYASINQHAWMFLSSYEKLRTYIVENKTIENMLHLGPRAFEEIGGEVVQSTTFVLRNTYIKNNNGNYIGLTNEKTALKKKEVALEVIRTMPVSHSYLFKQENFKKIPGNPIAYWSTEKVQNIFENYTKLSEVAKPKQGLSTCNNDLFLRQWYEINFQRIGFLMEDREAAQKSQKKWFPYNKGGGYRKWYGNNDYVVNWEKDGQSIHEYNNLPMNFNGAPLRNKNYFFKKGLTWSSLTSGGISFRFCSQGFVFDAKGPMFFSDNIENNKYFLGLLNSKVVNELLKILSPTLDFNQGPISKIPVKFQEKEKVVLLVEQNIEMVKSEWDSFETSWDFQQHPLIKFNNGKGVLESAINNYINNNDNKRKLLKENEEKLNQVIINSYELHEELSPQVLDEDLSIKEIDLQKELKSYISYAVGCIFGRYSFEKKGLIFAGGSFDISHYNTFDVDKDNILPILSELYFEDDISLRIIEFIRVTFGEENLEKNLSFLSDAIIRKKNETAKEALNRYLLNDFYKDHVQVYKKRPIYWLFTSGKEKAFNCLIYMHRYDKTTLSRIRTDYLHEVQIRMDAQKKELLNVIEGDSTTKEISSAKKELKSLDKKIDELKAYDEKLHHMADMQIEIDLDDGVAVNYAKFEGLVAKI